MRLKFSNKTTRSTPTFWDIAQALALNSCNEKQEVYKITHPTLTFWDKGYIGAKKNETNQLNLWFHRLCYKITNPTRALPFPYPLVQ